MSEQSVVSRKPRLTWIEWVRGVAALMVAAHHLIQPAWPEYRFFADHVFNLGRVGVVAFFLVSGFVIPLSYARQTTRVFLVRRFTRLYPIYWLILFITILLDSWTSSQPFPGLSDVLLNMTMMQSLFGIAIVGVAWTLTIELLYYMQQVLFKTVKILEHSWKLGFFWLACYLGLVALEHVQGRELPISVPLFLAISCAGHLLSLFLIKQASGRATAFSISIILGGGLVGGFCRAEVDPQWPGYLYAVSTAGGIALFACAYLLRHRLNSAWMVWLGSISYALYLTHSLFLYLLPHSISQASWPAIFASLGALAGSVLVSWLLHLYVEQPFINLGRRFKQKSLTIHIR